MNKLTKSDLSVLNTMAKKAKYKNWTDFKKNILRCHNSVCNCLVDGMEKAVILSREKEVR